MDQRQNGGVKYALLPSGAHDPLRANFVQLSSYTSSKLKDGALFSLCRTELQSDADRSRRVEPTIPYSSFCYSINTAVSLAYCDMTAGRIILYTVGSRLIKCVGPSVNKTVHIWTKCNAVLQTGPSVNKTVHIWTKCNAVHQTQSLYAH